MMRDRETSALHVVQEPQVYVKPYQSESPEYYPPRNVSTSLAECRNQKIRKNEVEGDAAGRLSQV